MTGGSLQQRLAAHNEAIRYNVNVLTTQALHIYGDAVQSKVEHFAYYILSQDYIRLRQEIITTLILISHGTICSIKFDLT